MNALFALDAVVVALVALAMIVAMALSLRFARRHRFVLIGLQPLAAALLLAALSLRDAPSPTTLVVFTPTADAADIIGPAMRVALPGARAGEGVEAVPDLATALRRYAPDRVVVLGDGLARHDRDAVQGRAVAFHPSPRAEQAGFTEVIAPRSVPTGTWWTLRGSVEAGPELSLVLFDPAGAKIATTTPDAQGRFALEALARAAGPALFELKLLRGDKVLQTVPIPVVAETAAPLRVLVLAATPSPDLKYLRRWALDAGAQLEARIALAPGLGQRRGAAALDAATLAELDLLIVDERSWPQLAALQPALREAVRQGLGLLVRVTGPVPERVAQEWMAWGIDATSAAKPVEMRLPEAPQLLLHAWPASTEGEWPVLLATTTGAPVAQWHALGRGRVGSWRLADSHRLYTRGDRERHATLWSQAWSTLARPRAAVPTLPERAIAKERAVICGVDAEAIVATPAGDTVALSPVSGCAAFWPRAVGWHRLESDAPAQPFYVHDPATLASLLSNERRAATQALADATERAAQRDEGDGTVPPPPDAGNGTVPPPADASISRDARTHVAARSISRDTWRAILLALWLAVVTLAWWLERRASAAPTT